MPFLGILVSFNIFSWGFQVSVIGFRISNGKNNYTHFFYGFMIVLHTLFCLFLVNWTTVLEKRGDWIIGISTKGFHQIIGDFSSCHIFILIIPFGWNICPYSLTSTFQSAFQGILNCNNFYKIFLDSAGTMVNFVYQLD